MESERMPEPWFSFLTEIDRSANEPISLQCIGGFAVSMYDGLSRPTGDIDVIEVTPTAVKPWLSRTGGEGSRLHKRHKIYVQMVTVATVPYLYEERLTEMFEGQFQRLRLFVLDPYDLVLSKLSRNAEVDVEDAKHLVRSQKLHLALLEARYKDELRPDMTGPLDRHDLTMKLWLAAFREERDAQSGR